MNRESYDLIAADWSQARSAFHGRERDYLDAVLSAAPAGATILDLGCGTGRPMAEHIVAMGYRVLGVDQSEGMLAHARRHLPDEQWVLSAMEAYEPPAGCHGALLWDSLFHLPRALHALVLGNVVRALPAGARLMVTVGGSEHPAFTDVMFGQRFHYDSNTPEVSARILRDLGCRLVIAEFMNLPDGGRDKGRYALVAEKA